MASETKRVTITMPKKLLDDIRSHSTNISGFLSEAAAARLSQERYLRAVAKSAGTWRSENHPNLDTMDDIVAYVDHLRDTWTRED